MRRIITTIDSSSQSPSLCGFLVVQAYPKRYSSKIPSDLVLFLGLGFIDWMCLGMENFNAQAELAITPRGNF
ncbi:hypothetical protein RJ639_035312 [Escallonia herrerae]|uniref:Uncharacterized protein n=1 Tax=Escallonia herrerae TaxID=1293975 RepID=A0AA89BH67_9ASTE|nr:hypothetical protein RJ639_035312 [Escallonia herrerae]